MRERERERRDLRDGTILVQSFWCGSRFLSRCAKGEGVMMLLLPLAGGGFFYDHKVLALRCLVDADVHFEKDKRRGVAELVYLPLAI